MTETTKEIFEKYQVRKNKEQKTTLINITHYMDEAVRADRVIVIDDGRVLLDGTPAEIFKQDKILRECGLDLPIINPNDEDMMASIFAYNVLKNVDENAAKYIDRYAEAEIGTAEFGNPDGNVTIRPMYNADDIKHDNGECECAKFDDECDDCCVACECDIEQGKKDFLNYSVEKYLYGVNETDPEVIHNFRH